ncbi:hypothetical protein, partial [Polyangium jinanense]
EFDAWRKRNQYQPMSSRKFYRRTGMRSASNGTARMYPVTVMRSVPGPYGASDYDHEGGDE